MSTIVDVAKRAGVSIGTVSHVLNGTRPVREVTRTRVLDAIAEIGYTQDGVARALRRSRTDTVGLVVTDTGQAVFADMVRGVEHEARNAGMVVLLSNSADDAERELASVDALRQRRVDGVLIARVGDTRPEVDERLAQAKLPIVLLDRLVESDVDQVGVEAVEPMRRLVGHLIAKGHRDIAIVAGDLAVHSIQERYQGFVTSMGDAGLPVAANRVLTGTATVENTRAQVAAFLGGPDRPTALVTASIILTAGTLAGLADLGIDVPRDIALVAFDDFPYAELITPQITCVVQPAFDIGREAMRLLLRRLASRSAPPRTVRLRPAIAHRTSCGCAPNTPM